MGAIDLDSVIPNFGGSETLMGFDTSNMEVGQPIRGKSNRQFVRFYWKKIVTFVAKKVETNAFGSVKVLEKERVEKDVEMVNVVTPGEKNIVDDFAQDYHRQQFYPQYKAFRDGKTAPIGTPLEEVDFIGGGILTELKYREVHTVEQLADAGDSLCAIIPNGYELRANAQAIVKSNIDNKTLSQVNVLKLELEKSQKEMEKLREEMKSFLVDSKGRAISSGDSVEDKPTETNKIKSIKQ